MSFKDLWKNYIRTGESQADVQPPSWKKFLIEELETVHSPEEQQEPTALQPAEIPAELFHATRPPLLSAIAEQGLRDYSDFSRHGAGQIGVSFATELAPLEGGSFGNLVLVFDGKELAASNQYIFKSHQDPSIGTKEAEVRVTMSDSAGDSGSGIDSKVDALGTSIPFHFCRKMIFLYPVPKFELKWLKENYPSVEIQVLKQEKEENKE